MKTNGKVYPPFWRNKSQSEGELDDPELITEQQQVGKEETDT